MYLFIAVDVIISYYTYLQSLVIPAIMTIDF